VRSSVARLSFPPYGAARVDRHGAERTIAAQHAAIGDDDRPRDADESDEPAADDVERSRKRSVMRRRTLAGSEDTDVAAAADRAAEVEVAGPEQIRVVAVEVYRPRGSACGPRDRSRG
jgi:hypothetical protein